MPHKLFSACGVILLVLVSGCSTTLETYQVRQDAQFKFSRVSLDKVPFFPQQEYQCGPAALAMMLSWSGVQTEPGQLKPLVYVPEKKGSFQVELVAASRQFDRIPFIIEPSVKALIQELVAGNPVLVFQNLGLDWIPRWHYAVAIGVDVSAEQITLHTGTLQSYKMSLDTFERTWLRTGKWAMVVMAPGQIPKTANPVKYMAAVNAIESKFKFAMVKETYLAAIDKWPENLTVRMSAANYFFTHEKYDLARGNYQAVIQLDKQFAPAHNNFANLLLKLNQLDQAYQHARRAVEIGGQYSAQYADTLSEIESALNSANQLP